MLVSDNIIDGASCLSVELPVTVTVNGITLEINDDDGYEDIEDIIDLFDDDIDTVEIAYPITVILPDYSTVVVNSDAELAALTANCVGENEDDDDIECIDFQYPITASIYNSNNDLIDSITLKMMIMISMMMIVIIVPLGILILYSHRVQNGQ